VSSDQLQSNHDDALARYLDELLSADGDADGAVEKEQEPGVLLPCGHVSPEDERYYVCDVGGVGAAIPATRVSAEPAFEGTLAGKDGETLRTLTFPSGNALPVIDLAALILPPSAPATKPPLAERLRTLSVLDEGQWALASAGESRLELLDLDKVVWRGEQGSRPWLAGTLVDSRLVLLDLDALVATLP